VSENEKRCFDTSTPHAIPTAKNEYRNTLDDLTQLTFDYVKKYLSGREDDEGIAIVSAAAQQVNPSVKIDAVIA